MDFLRDITGVLTASRPDRQGEREKEREREREREKGGGEKGSSPECTRAEYLKIRFT